MSDPTGGWAAATTETVKALRSLGKAFAEPAQVIIGMATDHLNVVRLERQSRLIARVHATMGERGLVALDRPIPPNTLFPLIEQAEREDDNDLQDIWARMLVNAGDSGSSVEMRRAFVSMLADMTAFDVHMLARISAVQPKRYDLVLTGRLPNSASLYDESSGEQECEPREDVAVSLGNLNRLGCLTYTTALGGASLTRLVALTDLGRAFVTACTDREPQ